MSDAAHRLILNPFDDRLPPFHEVGAATLEESVEALGARVRKLPKAAARLAMLARAHAEVCCAPASFEKRVASRAWQRAWDDTGLARMGAFRIVFAAGRCHAALSEIVGSSTAIRRVRRDTWAACFGHSLEHGIHRERVIRDHDVLILGETGTGKEAVARAIASAASSKLGSDPAPYAAVNAAAVPETLIESELFGHARGAFTGATSPRRGRIRAAHEGCFFLDEVGDLPPYTQVKLLRVMETNEVNPLGSDSSEPADVRYIAATHKPLLEMIDQENFRRDLYERLAGLVIRLPPLRERPDDIVDIGLHFVDRTVGDRVGEERDQIRRWLRSPTVQSHAWPGNVRQLHNSLRSLLLGLTPDLDEATDPAPRAPQDVPARLSQGSASLADVTAWYVGRVLRAQEGNYSGAARVLGIDRATVRRHLAD